ncbi:hypothetical protein MXD81_14905, partial [Microbacteriaceae bacterium K1510]|nr:hypothetical protein [Microbacteriaceae bacterium K1510]
GYNQTVKASYDVTIPKEAGLFLPYEKPVLTADVTYEAFNTAATVHAVPADAVAVLPPFALSLDPSATVLNTLKPDQPLPVKVTVRNYTPGAAEANVSLNVPEGWSVQPAESKL